MEHDKSHLIIAIDGPAGSGKSTVSKIVAKRSGLLYLDTGAMYRALTLKAMRSGVNLNDAEALTKLASVTELNLEMDGPVRVLLDGQDVSGAIRTVEVTNNIKYIARVPGVRHQMVRMQREIGRRRGAVLEGRDITTVVFPDARYKFYLDADPDERARRRHKEFVESGNDIGLDEIKKDVTARDESDMKRSVGPLKKSPDAIVIDTTKLTIEQVVERILGYMRSQDR